MFYNLGASFEIKKSADSVLIVLHNNIEKTAFLRQKGKNLRMHMHVSFYIYILAVFTEKPCIITIGTYCSLHSSNYIEPQNVT